LGDRAHLAPSRDKKGDQAMTPEHWQRVRDLLHAALQLAPEQRSAFLDQECLTDHSLRHEVQSFLDSGDETLSSFLRSSTMRATLSRGTRIADYELESLLGSGAMGEVYRARDLRLGREVAIKLLPGFLSSDPERLRRFDQEARSAAALNHPNILAVFQMGTYEGAPYLVSELMEGSTLREHMRRGPLEIARAIDYGAQIADGLAAAHEKGVVHRDVKPENLFLTRDERIKILDFGLAKISSARAAETGFACETDPGTVMGTLAYMSPEQALGTSLDSRTDLFSLGAVLYEMVAGRRAFDGNSSAAIYDAILNRAPVPLRLLRPDLHGKLDAILFRAMEKNRDLRYQVASDIRDDLKRLKRDLDSGNRVLDETHTVTRLAGQKGKNNWPKVMVAFAIVVLLLTGREVLYRYWKTSQDSSVLRVKQLTRNSSENSVGSGAISPDGKYLAYSDLKGMHIQMIATGETLDVAQPEPLAHTQANWEFFGGWLPDSTRFIADARMDGSHFGWTARDSSIWAVSLLGKLRKLRDHASAFSVSPDGTWIAFAPGPALFSYHEVWLMRPDGEQAHKIFEADHNISLNNVVWSPDGKRLAYLKFDQFGTATAIESRDLDTGRTTEILPASGSSPLSGFQWPPDGELSYSLTEPGTGARTCNYWRMAVDLRTGQPTGEPKQVANWLPECLKSVSFTADGKHAALLRGSGMYTIYVADLEANGTRITAPKRLTLNESHNIPSGWTPDSKTVIFISDYNGSKEIFRQSIDSAIAQSVFAQPGIAGAARLAPDGSWILYLVQDPTPGQKKLMRLPLTGGAAQPLFSGDFVNGGARCARSPATVCAVAERSPDHRRLVFTSIDLLNGRGQELTRFETDPGRDLNYFWDLSPDGTRIAVLNTEDAEIQILSLSGQQVRKIAVENGHGLGYVTWMADGSALVVGVQDKQSASLLSVDMHGNIHPLWKQEGAYAISGLPSPNGRHIAIWVWTMNDNFWIADNP